MPGKMETGLPSRPEKERSAQGPLETSLKLVFLPTPFLHRAELFDWAANCNL